jgi:hypothetical protein
LEHNKRQPNDAHILVCLFCLVKDTSIHGSADLEQLQHGLAREHKLPEASEFINFCGSLAIERRLADGRNEARNCYSGETSRELRDK